MLSPAQSNLLVELLNINLEMSANSLSEMIERRIIIHVPDVVILSVKDINLTHRGFTKNFFEGDILISSLKFNGAFEGKSLLVFSLEGGKTLASLCMGLDIDIDKSGSGSITEDDSDTLKEVTNTLLNTLIGEFGNLINITIDYDVPQLTLIDLNTSIHDTLNTAEYSKILLVQTYFSISNTPVSGYILIFLSERSMSLLIDKIDSLLEHFNV